MILPDIEVWLFLFALGGVVGFLSGLLGIGGGAIMVPALTSLLLHLGFGVGKAVHFALGTSMACIMVTSIGSVLAHHFKGTIQWALFKWLAPGVMVGAFLATFAVPYIHAIYLSGFFALFMGYVAVNMLRASPSSSGQCKLTPQSLLSVGAGIGSVSSLVSIGGGTMTVPYLFKRGYSMPQAIGTSAALGLPLSIMSSAGYMMNGWHHTNLSNLTIGYIFLPAFAGIVTMSVLFAPLGAKAAVHLPVVSLKKLFAGLLVCLSANMVYSVISAS